MPDDSTSVTLPPINATFRGPGPGRYMLPTTCSYSGHDFSKNRKPCYSFGTRHLHALTNDCSPGPKYLANSRLTKNGLEGNPKHSLGGTDRYAKRTIFNVPGAGEYSPEQHHIPHERKAPSYSFGSRTKYSKNNVTPSPSSYSLPALIGPKVVSKKSAAAHSMTGRSNIGGFSEDLQKTPGPGTYKVTSPNKVKGRCPSYSINGRNFMPGDSTLKPGPGQHSPEKVRESRPPFLPHQALEETRTLFAV
ncbi:hypothetical protein QZH41_011777 [Actinostola sp. cb2023]|nr:hypothetical protein QZH41_011777 [Actinostola sp. cb2023]